MGSSCSKVGLLPEASSKSGHFSFMKSVVNKNKDFGENFSKQKKTHPWSWTSNRGTKDALTDGDVCRNGQSNNHEVKFRTKFDPRVTARYDIKALIGRGNFSRVVRVEHRQTRQPFAIKLLEVKGHEGRESCRAELGVLRRVRHANVVHLVEVFETPHRVYLILELATGGELLERVVAQGSFTERDATRALIMVSSGLRYIHNLGVVHRDLKPENLLYYHPGPDSRLIITDFGLACWSRKIQTVKGEEIGARGTCDAGRHQGIVGCAGPDRDYDRSASDANICGVVDVNGKDAAIGDCRRLADDGKARESSQGRVFASGGDERGDANGCLDGTLDEREIDESSVFDGKRGSTGEEEEEVSCGTQISGATKKTERGVLKQCQTKGFEGHKHNNLDRAKEKEDRVGEERQIQFSHEEVKDSRQTNCSESTADRGDNCQQNSLHNNIKNDPSRSSEGRKAGDWAVRTLCGTPEYLAPEMLGGRHYGCAVDMWALGVITYILLSGSMPFDQRSRPRLFRAILRGSYSFHGEPWSSISNQAKDFIENLLTVSPGQRMTAEQALKHPWLVTMAGGSTNKNLHRPISRNLRQRASRASSRSPSSGFILESRTSISPLSYSGQKSHQFITSISQHKVRVPA